ncbi:DNA polymerase III subunit gamma/tau [Candidatus Acetothermia bacterium]|nr:DNA polymerase III subunit gamma/tau [Candidatus Acetothermia bacterium]MCI2427115.1 DNA polymerase III subunit gamma/tau [Candidatus Acetothermia bacterium]MCI2428465.1 DNA polymerase III subunit gamma/tau [Candidatus Acetothermia bacterium]
MTNRPVYRSLYRRWRPQRFSEVVGQVEIIQTLRNAVLTGKISHAYLFAGERGIGKTTIARILARAVNCLHPAEGEPCNTCANCMLISNQRAIDVIEIDGASNRGIDHIRQLREGVQFSPAELRYKVYIIDEVHMLTNEAFNALLKTLEEPPPRVLFVFATTEPHKLPATIISRCQAFDFTKIPPEKIALRIKDICHQEGITIEDGAVALLSRKANGALRDPLVMLEQAVAFAQKGPIIAQDLLDMLGAVGPEFITAFFNALIKGDHQQVLLQIADLVERGKEIELFLGDLISFVRDTIVSDGTATEEVHLTVAQRIELCQGLLLLKQDLVRSIDQRIIVEVGILGIMNELGLSPQRSGTIADLPAKPAANLQHNGQRSLSNTPSRLSTPHKADADRTTPPKAATDNSFAKQWEALFTVIEQERISIAAFLSEGEPSLDKNRLQIAFDRKYSFHKESLEKRENLQYLVGMVRRYLGPEIDIDIRFADGVTRRLSPTEELQKKAELVCQIFAGKIVKEE